MFRERGGCGGGRQCIGAVTLAGVRTLVSGQRAAHGDDDRGPAWLVFPFPQVDHSRAVHATVSSEY